MSDLRCKGRGAGDGWGLLLFAAFVLLVLANEEGEYTPQVQCIEPIVEVTP